MEENKYKIFQDYISHLYSSGKSYNYMKTSSVINGIKCRLNDLAFGGTMNHFLRKKV